MKFLDKIFPHRQNKAVDIHPSIRICGAVPTDKLREVEQIIRSLYKGKESETKVVEEIKKATGLRAGHVSLEYNKRHNTLTVFYCC